MSMKTKRIVYSESDCHTLVDIVINYKDIVECKKTDAITWKEKVATWEKITELYNSASTEPRTSEQLRCKFDNLKKEVRKYEAQKRQNLYRTGGGNSEIDIKAALKLLYEKIKSIISFSVKGLEPGEGDSDILYLKTSNKKEVDIEQEQNLEIQFYEDSIPSTSQVIHVMDFGKVSDQSAQYEVEVQDNPNNIVSSQPLKEIKNVSDWSDYSPKKLQSKKHKVLQRKRKRTRSETDAKEELVLFKRKLLEEEAVRNKIYHDKRVERENEIHVYKKRNLELQNQKLELEIELLKKQLS